MLPHLRVIAGTVFLILTFTCHVFASSSKTWIIALKPPVNVSTYDIACKDVQQAGGQVIYKYKSGFKGLAATLPSEQAAEAFKNKDYVSFVEKDGEAHSQLEA